MASSDDSMRHLDRSVYAARGRARVVQGDLFAAPAFVIPVKTQGRSYGQLSQQLVARGATIPALTLTEAKAFTHHDHLVVCVAFWDDESPYTDALVLRCTRNAVLRAAAAGAVSLAMPLLGEKDKTAFLAAMERGVELALDHLDEQDRPGPEVCFVTDRVLA
jgi:hypothetical protein